MRRHVRQHALSLFVILLALSLAGCYTMIKHPDVTDEYAIEGDEADVVIIDNCGTCHEIYDPRPIPRHRRRDDGAGGGSVGSIRPIDPSNPVRKKNPIGPGDRILPPGGAADGGTDTKTRDNPTDTQKGSTEVIKKEQPDGGKTPVRRDTDGSKTADDKDKTTDKKKE